MRTWSLMVAILSLAAMSGDLSAAEQAKAEVKTAPPLAGLPSKPGPHIEQIKALGDNAWLKLPETTADPTCPSWGGKSYGRSWTPTASYAAELGGAFITGEGGHSAARGGYYGDDVWFYDLYANRWINIYPGTHLPTFGEKLKDGIYRIDDIGIIRDKDDQAIPVCTMTGHGGFLMDYDKANRKFVWAGTTVGWLASKELRHPYDAAMKEQGKKLLYAGLWMYDVASGKTEWFKKDKDHLNAPSKGDSLGWIQYVDSNRKLLMSTDKRWGIVPPRTSLEWWYDMGAMKVESAPRKGDIPLGFGGTCYDPKRDRVYAYVTSTYNPPPDKPFVPEEHFYYFDVKTGAWVNPKARNSPNIPSLTNGRWMMEYDTVNDKALVLYVNMTTVNRFIHVYDPETNEFEKPIPVSDKDLPTGNGPCHSFFCPELNAFFIHGAAGDNRAGNTYVWRYKRAPEKK